MLLPEINRSRDKEREDIEEFSSDELSSDVSEDSEEED